MTEKLYLKDTYLFQSPAKILEKGCDDRGCFVVLDQTIFYPQGGGQPSDQGLVGSCIVFDVRMIGGFIRHYIKGSIHTDHVTLKLDQTRRITNARHHTAGQLLGNVIGKKFSLSVLKSHHFPNESYLEFEELPYSVDNLEEILNQLINEDRPIKTFEVEQKNFSFVFQGLFNQEQYLKFESLRAVQIDGFPAVPCGGTHVSSLKEIESIRIRKIATSGRKTKISYDVSSNSL